MKEEAERIRERNNRRDSQLSLENRAYMTQVICHLREKNAEEEKIEDIRQDLTDILTEAQKRGEAAEDVLGEDSTFFSEEILEGLGEREEETDTRRNLELFVSWLPLWGLLQSGFYAFFWGLKGAAWSFEDFFSSLVFIPLMFAVTILIKLFTRRFLKIKMREWTKGKKKYLTFFCIAFFAAAHIFYFLQSGN